MEAVIRVMEINRVAIQIRHIHHLVVITHLHHPEVVVDMEMVKVMGVEIKDTEVEVKVMEVVIRDMEAGEIETMVIVMIEGAAEEEVEAMGKCRIYFYLQIIFCIKES